MEYRGTSTITGGTINIVPPTVAAPTITVGPSSGTPGETSATITWTTSTLTDSNICRGASGGPWNICNGVNSSLVTSHSMVFIGLSASTTYYYKVYSTDSTGQQVVSSQNSFATSAAAGCGAPNYTCGDSSTTVQTYQAWPVAAQTVNTVFNDPIFSTQILRALDTSTDPCDQSGHQVPVGSGVADDSGQNYWAADSTGFVARIQGASTAYSLLMDFNPATLVVTPHPGNGGGSCRKTSTSGWLELTGTGHFSGSGGGIKFSLTDPDLIYGKAVENNRILRKLTRSVGGGTFSDIKNLAAADCFPDLDTSSGDMWPTKADNVFAWAGNKSADASKGQDHWTQLVVYYAATNVCRRLDLSTGVVSEGTNPSGFPVGTSADAFRSAGIHATRITQDGKYFLPTVQTCTAGCGSFVAGSRVAWEIETTNILLGGEAKYKQHGVAGHHSLFNLNSSGTPLIQATDLTVLPIASVTRETVDQSTETYLSSPNANSGDTHYFALSKIINTGFRQPNKWWESELVMVAASGAVAHSRQVKVCTTYNASFLNIGPRGVVSPDGAFVLWPDKGDACSQDIGRRDLFIAKLQ